jgi:hypothetical protein
MLCPICAGNKEECELIYDSFDWGAKKRRAKCPGCEDEFLVYTVKSNKMFFREKSTGVFRHTTWIYGLDLLDDKKFVKCRKCKNYVKPTDIKIAWCSLKDKSSAGFRVCADYKKKEMK